MDLVMLIAAMVIAYFAGFPYSYVVGKIIRGIDLRQCGSGNLGASNTLRVLGKKIGVVVLAADVLKGVLIVLVLPLILYRAGGIIDRELFVVLAAAAGVAGHNWPVLLHFQGGKGVAIMIGIFVGIAPLCALCALAFFVLTVAAARYISIGSIMFGISLPIFVLLFHFPTVYVYFGIAAALSIVYRHQSNIKRILGGTENKLGKRSV